MRVCILYIYIYICAYAYGVYIYTQTLIRIYALSCGGWEFVLVFGWGEGGRLGIASRMEHCPYSKFQTLNSDSSCPPSKVSEDISDRADSTFTS